jgi:AhpD family alkylhydroperoxidase
MSHVRFDIGAFRKAAPAAVAALAALGQSAIDAGLDKGLIELVKIRASQVNGCAYCVQYHLNLARELGVAAAKLDQLVVWRDSPAFDAKERAALAWAEALTDLSTRDVPDAVYAEALQAFGAADLAHLSSAVAVINAWNRLGVAFRWAPPAPRAKAAAS